MRRPAWLRPSVHAGRVWFTVPVCDWIAVSELLGSASEEERAQAFEDIVVRHLELEGAAATRAQINEVWDIARDQIVSLQTTGSLSEQELLTDLACVL